MRLIHSKKASLVAGSNFMLVPGINQIDDKVWAIAKETFAIKHLLKTGEIVDETPEALAQSPAKVVARAPLSEPGEPVVVEEEAPLPSMRDVPADQAVSLIRKTLDVKLLDRWESEDNRQKVLTAISKQRAKIEAAANRPKEGQPMGSPDIEPEEA